MIKINREFYQIENYYNNDIYGEYKEDIEKYINEYSREEYYKIIENDKRVNIVNIFSDMRFNIIKWMDIKEDSKILEVGANYGEITSGLINVCKDVTSIEFSEDKVNLIAKRLGDNTNINIYLCTHLKDLKLEEKYDYITLIGVAEYCNKLGFENLNEMIEWALNHLKEDGKILIALDNKFGVKYLAGSTINATQVPYANFKPYIKKDYQTYGKDELEKILSINNLNYKFYYPVPNFYITSCIYTDKYLPKKADYDIYYRENEEILFNELFFMNEAIKNNKFSFFTNSFLVEIVKKEQQLFDAKYIDYNNMRKKDYQIITTIYDDRVIKKEYGIEAKEHINSVKNNLKKLKELGFESCDDIQEDRIFSKFISLPTMDEYLKELLEKEEIDKIYMEFYKWEQFLKSKLEISNAEKNVFDKYDIEISEEEKNKMTFVKNGFIDLIFQNVFYDGNNEYIIFDQEWYEEGVPLEFLIYRSIKELFFKYKTLANKINIDDIFQKYNIEKFTDIFDELENKWQEKIVDNSIFKFYSEKWERITSLEDIKFKFNQELGKVYKEKDELYKEKVDLLEQNQKLNDIINDLNEKLNDKKYMIKKFFNRGKENDE